VFKEKKCTHLNRFQVEKLFGKDHAVMCVSGGKNVPILNRIKVRIFLGKEPKLREAIMETVNVRDSRKTRKYVLLFLVVVPSVTSANQTDFKTYLLRRTEHLTKDWLEKLNSAQHSQEKQLQMVWE
jgi:hypothetical protein